MEYYLTPPQTFSFRELSQLQIEGREFRVLQTHVPVRIFRKEGSSEVPDKYSSILHNALRAQNFGPKRPRFDLQDMVKNGVEFWIGCRPPSPMAFVRIFCNDLDDPCLSRLEQVCGGNGKLSYGFDLEFGADDVKMKVVASGLKIRYPQMATNNRSKVPDLFHVFQLSEPLAQRLAEENAEVRGNLSLIVTLSDEVLNGLHSKGVSEPLSRNKKILENAECSDLVLIPENGVKVHCHKCFLSAQSPVFQAMFKSDMQEGLSCTVQLPDMSESAVRALLAYLYFWDITEISKSSSVAFELLLASNKYDIPRLEKSVQDVILAKENDWFTVSVTVQLTHFAKTKSLDEKDETYKLIAKKAVTIMKTMSNEELHECAEYQQLFSDSKYGMEFCSFLLRF